MNLSRISGTEQLQLSWPGTLGPTDILPTPPQVEAQGTLLSTPGNRQKGNSFCLEASEVGNDGMQGMQEIRGKEK
jgi:hypothetical protein